MTKVAVSRTKKQKPKGGTVSVWLEPGQKVIVTRKPKAEDYQSSYFIRWIVECKEVEPNIWPRATKHHPKCQRKFCVCEKNHIAISDMHVMEVVNAIKWCVRQADIVLRSPWYGFSESRASILARSPQWAALLDEAKKRDLKMIERRRTGDRDSFASWFEESLIAIGMNRLERGNKSGS